jgi:hypothetical protein
LFTSLISFAVVVALSAGLLHAAIRMTGGSHKATTGTAFAASGAMVVASFLCGMIPFLGVPLALLASVGIVMHFYETTLGRGVLVLVLQLLMAVAVGVVSALVLGGMGVVLL